MKRLLFISFLLFTLSLEAQHEIQFRDGDHIYVLETRYDTPVYHQVGCCNNWDELITFYNDLIKDGTPGCEIYFDPRDYRSLTLRRDFKGNLYVQSMADRLNDNLLAVNMNPDTQPIFYNNKVEFSQDRYLVIQTPHLTKATSFIIQTNNRVFVFVKQPTRSTQEL